MRIGYIRSNQPQRQQQQLEASGIEELFVDQRGYDIFTEPTSEYLALLDYLAPGDCLVITSLDVLSRSYEQLLECLEVFQTVDIALDVLQLPEMSLDEFQAWLQWSLRNERLLYPRLMELGKEENRNKNHYSVFSKDPEGKKLYRQVMSELISKEKMKKIADQNGVPLETVYRINQELERIRLAIILVFCFLLAIVGIKLTENFSDNILIQVVVCVVATLVILYNTLVDSEEW